MKKQSVQSVILAVVLIIVAAISRLIPHPPNFAPIASLAIFGGAIIANKKYALILPLGALLLSDILFQLFTKTPGFYDISQSFVYGAFILITFLATRIRSLNTKNILFACLWGGVIFFILSNFGVWLTGVYYPKTVAGLISCYEAAIPFYTNDFFGNLFLNTIMSDLFYTMLLFGIYFVIRSFGFQKTAVTINYHNLPDGLPTETL